MDFAVIGATTKKEKRRKKKETRKEGRLFHETNFRSFMYLPDWCEVAIAVAIAFRHHKRVCVRGGWQ